MMLVATCRSALIGQIGAAGWDESSDLLADYIELLQGAGRSAQLAVLDDDESMSALSTDPIQDNGSAAIRLSLESAIKRLEPTGRVDELLLIGGDAVIPFWRLVNPVADRDLDPDAVVLSDNPYGLCEDNSLLKPTVAVGRICDGGDRRTLTDSLKAVMTNVRAASFQSGSLAVVNEEWAEVSNAAVSRLEPTVELRFSPYYAVQNGHQTDLHHRLLYFNLHGFDGDSLWRGYDASRDYFAPAVSPDSFRAAEMAGAVVVTEACYGAQVQDRTRGNSCALAAQAEGAAGVIGATGLVFGSVLNPGLASVAGADRLAPLVIDELARGERVGRALLAGRRAFVGAGDLTPYERKTALQFVLLGDPSSGAM